MKKVKFGGIDSFNRPVFVNINNPKDIYGSTDILFAFGSTEADVLAKVTEDDLCYFGNHLDCEPMGTPAGEIIILRPQTTEPVVGKHTQTPWNVDGLGVITGGEHFCTPIAETYLLKWIKPTKGKTNQRMISQARSNGEFIVRACNCHDELVNVLEKMIGWEYVGLSLEDGNNLVKEAKHIIAKAKAHCE